jgi:competence protein ComEC
VKDSSSIVRLGDARVFTPLAWIYNWRERLQREIDTRFSLETAGVLDAALIGNRYNLPRAASERFREGGTFHVLVISGLHISFIGGLVFLIARRLTKSRLLQFVLSTTVVWSYSLAVGAEASVVRAALMFTFITLAAVVFRQASSFNALGGAALVLLVRNPKEIFDPSLQLTFLSVLAIVLVAWPILQTCSAIGTWHPTRESPYPPLCSRGLKLFSEVLFWSEQKWQREIARCAHHCRLFKVPHGAWLERHHLQSLLRYIFGAVVVSTAVQLVLLPLQIIYFHRLSLVSLVLNVGVSLLLAVLAAVALVALLVSQLNVILARPLFELADAIEWLMVHSVDPFTKLGLASFRLPEYSGRGFLVYIVYYVPLILLVVLLFRWRPLIPPVNKKNRQRFVPALVFAQLTMLAVVVLHPLSSARGDGRLHIDFLDVGQGDAALMTMPDGTTLLVDGGGRPGFLNSRTQAPTAEVTEPLERETRSIGETVVSEYLWWRGLDRIDYILATHADADHIDGLNDVVRNFSVNSALVARTPAEDLEFVKFSQTLATTKTHVVTIQAGDVFHFGDVELRVLWPLFNSDKNAASRNNDSIVLRVKFGNRAVLLTGDIESNAEAALVQSQQDLQVDVVKVPHHGSKTSSTAPFVLATKPGLAIISVGQNSMFGHPHKEVVERWQANGAMVFTTGKCGTITLSTDGRELTVRKFVQE